MGFASPLVAFAGCFLWAHHFALYSVASIGLYLHAKKWSTAKKVEMCDTKVAQGMYEDTKRWMVQRWRDLQAIKIVFFKQGFQAEDATTALLTASNHLRRRS